MEAASSVASSAEGTSSVDSSALHSSEDESSGGARTVDRIQKKVSMPRRRSSVRKPRTKGITKKLQDQVRLVCCYAGAECFFMFDDHLPIQ